MLLDDALTINYDEIMEIEMLHNRLITEAQAHVVRFTYERAKNDPKPRVLILGRWRHPTTGNKLVVGINLNYLDDSQILQIKKHILHIMEPSTLRNRWWRGFALLRNVWLRAYRQYDERFVHSIEIADFAPETKDYTSPQQPGEPTPPPETTAINKLETQAKDESPQKPSKRRTITRFAKDTLGRIVNAVKSKLSINKSRDKAKEKAKQLQNIEQEKKKTAEHDLKNVERLDAEKKAAKIQDMKDIANLDNEADQNEIEKIKRIEDEHKQEEGRLINLDVILESTVTPRYLTWNSPKNYIYWHDPDRFTQYQPKLRGAIVDYATGNKLITIYNIAEEKYVMDLANHPSEVLALANWDWASTIRIIYDDGQTIIEHDCECGDVIIEEDVKNSAAWQVIENLQKQTSNKHTSHLYE